MKTPKEFYTTVALKLRKFYLNATAKIRNHKITNTNFTIISNNCWGGLVYQSYNLPYQTPTVGLFFMADDYLKFIYHLDRYLSIDKITEVKISESKHSAYLKSINYHGIIGKLDDIEIMFMHYHNIQEAVEKWNRRKKRINKDNILFKFSEQNESTKEHLEKFLTLKTPNKICFVSKQHHNIHHPNAQLLRVDTIGSLDEPIGASRIKNINLLINDMQPATTAPKISIIIPVYNVEKYLRECLDSVAQQTYQNLEVILADDGSTDSSSKICEEYSEKYANFKVYHKKNEGLGLTRNYGLSKITGEYVIFLDSDDYISHDLVEKLYLESKRFGADIVKSGFCRITDAKKVISLKKYQAKFYRDKSSLKSFSARMLGSSASKKDGVEMSVCGVLYKSNIIKNHHLKFVSERDFISEDVFFNLEYLEYAHAALLTNYTDYYYRMNSSSLTHKYYPNKLAAVKKQLNTLQNLLIKYHYPPKDTERLSRQFFVYLRSCLSQENPRISQCSKQVAYKNIEKICSDQTVLQTINNYPVRKLGPKQQFFLHLVAKQRFKTLYTLINLGAI